MQNVWREPHFRATVVEALDNAILVSVSEGEEVLNPGALVYVPLDVELGGSIDNFISADEVIVYFDGAVVEGNPAQLSRVYTIVLTSRDKSTPWHFSHRVDVSHVSDSQTVERTITNRHLIDDLFFNWFSNLSLSRKRLAYGESPSALDNVEVYYFTFHIAQSFTVDIDGEHTDIGGNIEHFSFSYGRYGAEEWYLFYYDEWYRVNNPSSPFDNFPMHVYGDVLVNDVVAGESETSRDDEYAESSVAPIFTSEPLPKHIIEFITGITFREDTPFPPSFLTYLTITHVGFDGEDRIGSMIVAAEIGDEVLEIFEEIYESGFPIYSMML